MDYVLGIDLGTSSVKIILVDRNGELLAESSKDYPLYQPKAGFSEQEPEDWVQKTIEALKEIMEKGISPEDIKGISFSGQMHGLVLIDEKGKPLRKAILWNDTRTTAECDFLMQKMGDKLIKIAKNKALEGFTLPKILWVRENEKDIFQKASKFLLPKDYLRYRLTGNIAMDFSDAAGTLLLDVSEKKWSREILEKLSLAEDFCPDLVESHAFCGNILPEIAEKTGLSLNTKVFAGGADNSCGALGAGVLDGETAMCSIGTSGVMLACETDKEKDFGGRLHFFNYSKTDSFYIMGVTLAAGYSLSWFKESFAPDIGFDEFLDGIENIPIGSNGLIFSPYIMGERTPYTDSQIRGSFVGISGSNTQKDFTRSIMEGIVFSLKDSLEIIKASGKKIEKIISIGGGAKNEIWLQMQADIFNAKIVKLKSEQGPALGAAIIAAVGSGMFESYEECIKKFVSAETEYLPDSESVLKYTRLYEIYKKIYGATKEICTELSEFR